MNDKLKEKKESATLSDNEMAAIKKVSELSVDRLAELGFAYLGYSEAELRFSTAKALLVKAKADALEAEMVRGEIVSSIAASLDLAPGEWVYEKNQCKLIKKDT